MLPKKQPERKIPDSIAQDISLFVCFFNFPFFFFPEWSMKYFALMGEVLYHFTLAGRDHILD